MTRWLAASVVPISASASNAWIASDAPTIRRNWTRMLRVPASQCARKRLKNDRKMESAAEKLIRFMSVAMADKIPTIG